MSTSSDNSTSSEEDHQEHHDDNKMIEENTLYNIRYTDDINKFKDINNQDGSFLYDERIRYGIDLSKKKIRKAFESIFKSCTSHEFECLMDLARKLPKLYDMPYPAILSKLCNPPPGYRFQYKPNKNKFEDESEQWHSNGKIKNHKKWKKIKKENSLLNPIVLYLRMKNGLIHPIIIPLLVQSEHPTIFHLIIVPIPHHHLLVFTV